MDYRQKRGPSNADLSAAFNPERTYNPEDDLSPEDLKQVQPFKGTSLYPDKVNDKLSFFNRLKQLMQTHALNNNSIQKGTYED